MHGGYDQTITNYSSEVVYVKLCKVPVMAEAVLVQGGRLQQVLLLLLEEVHAQVAVVFEPPLVGFRAERPDQLETVRRILEDADHSGAALTTRGCLGMISSAEATNRWDANSIKSWTTISASTTSSRPRSRPRERRSYATRAVLANHYRSLRAEIQQERAERQAAREEVQSLTEDVKHLRSWLVNVFLTWGLVVAVVGALLAAIMNQLTRALWAAFLVWWNS